MRPSPRRSEGLRASDDQQPQGQAARGRRFASLDPVARRWRSRLCGPRWPGLAAAHSQSGRYSSYGRVHAARVLQAEREDVSGVERSRRGVTRMREGRDLPSTRWTSMRARTAARDGSRLAFCSRTRLVGRGGVAGVADPVGQATISRLCGALPPSTRALGALMVSTWERIATDPAVVNELGFLCAGTSRSHSTSWAGHGPRPVSQARTAGASSLRWAMHWSICSRCCAMVRSAPGSEPKVALT